MTDMHDYLGRCTCGRVEIHLNSSLEPSEFQPRSDAATCAFCREHDGVWISDPKGMLTLASDDGTSVRTFASEQVQFHFCPECHDLTYAIFDDGSGTKPVAVARVALFEAIRGEAPPTVTTNFEGEAQDVGRRRRLEKWTPVRRLGAR
jgi:hypothetical protein